MITIKILHFKLEAIMPPIDFPLPYIPFFKDFNTKFHKL